MVELVVIYSALLIGAIYPGVLLAGCLFTYQAEAISGHQGVSYIYSGVALAIAAVRWWKTKPSLTPGFLDVAYLTFILGYSATVVYAPGHDLAVLAAQKLLVAALSLYAIGRLSVSEKNFERVVSQFVVGLLAYGLAMGVLLYLAPRHGVDARLSTETGSAVGVIQPLPLELVCGVIAAIALVNRKRWWLLAPLVACEAFVAYLAVLSGTRGVFIAAAMGLMAALAVGWRMAQWGRLILLGMAAVVAVVTAAPELPQNRAMTYSIERLAWNFGSGGPAADQSTQDRIDAQRNAINIFLQKKKFGAGIGGFYYLTSFEYPHNMVLEVAAEFGLTGLMLLALYLLALVSAQWRLVQVWSGSGVVIMAVTAAALMHMQLSFTLFMAKHLFLLTGMTASAIAGIRRNMVIAQKARQRAERAIFAMPRPRPGQVRSASAPLPHRSRRPRQREEA